MSVLYRNDQIATFPDSWYAASVETPALRPTLTGHHRVDACVIGAGYTGLSAARVMAAAGLSVIVLDAHRAGFGASGRNGGQVASGYNVPQRKLARKLGADTAKALWDLTEEAKADVAAQGPQIALQQGIAHGCYADGERADAEEDAAFLQAAYGYDKISTHDTAAFAEIVKSPLYRGGVLDMGGAHIHPLRYALILTQLAEAAGAVIYDQSPVHHIAKGKVVEVRTDKGRVQADHVVLATNGYHAGLDRALATRIRPVNSFIIATEPLDALASKVLSRPIAVEDSKHFVNYFRMSEDGRMLFGGRATGRTAFPEDIAGFLRPRMTGLFPQLKDARIDYAWGGTLGMTLTRLPSITRIAPNIVSAGGYTGHGVALSGLCGKILGEAVCGQASRFDVLSQLPAPAFPGGAVGGSLLLKTYLTFKSLREKLSS